MASKKWFLPAVLAAILLLPVACYTVLYLLAPG